MTNCRADVAVQAGHAYGVLKLVVSESTGLRFFEIRNLHASNESTGPWSDNSKELSDNPAVRHCSLLAQQALRLACG